MQLMTQVSETILNLGGPALCYPFLYQRRPKALKAEVGAFGLRRKAQKLMPLQSCDIIGKIMIRASGKKNTPTQ